MFERVRIWLRKLPWRLQRKFTNIGYSLRIFRAPTTRRVRLSSTLLMVTVFIFVGFILAGGIYDLTERPISLLPTAGGYSVLIRGTLGQQTLNESLIAGFMYLLGLSGLYMLLRSTRFAYRPRNAYLLLIMGTFTILIAVFYANSMITSKIGG